jgi:predicted O-methyltransferase YrrM
MTDHQPINIVMIEDDQGHARLIEKNIRRAGIANTIRHFSDGTSALEYIFNGSDPGGYSHHHRRSPRNTALL